MEHFVAILTIGDIFTVLNQEHRCTQKYSFFAIFLSLSLMQYFTMAAHRPVPKNGHLKRYLNTRHVLQSARQHFRE